MGYTGDLQSPTDFQAFFDEWRYMNPDFKENFRKIAAVQAGFKHRFGTVSFSWFENNGNKSMSEEQYQRILRAIRVPGQIIYTPNERGFLTPTPTPAQYTTGVAPPMEDMVKTGKQWLDDINDAMKRIREGQRKQEDIRRKANSDAWNRIAQRYAPGDPIMMNQHDFDQGVKMEHSLGAIN